MNVSGYVTKFYQYSDDPTRMWEPGAEIDPRVTPSDGVALDLINEIKGIIRERKARTGVAIAAVIREQNAKWWEIARRLKLKQTHFLDMLKKVDELLYEGFVEFTDVRRAA